MAYAEKTQVPSSKTKVEIETLLRKVGATTFGTAQEGAKALVFFRLKDRMVRFTLDLPENEQQERTRWRALLLVVKAKLESVATGLVTFEDEFLANTVMSDGQTVGDVIQPQITENYRVGGPPRLALTGPS